MSSDVIAAAIIGGIFTIIAALISVWRRKEADIGKYLPKEDRVPVSATARQKNFIAYSAEIILVFIATFMIIGTILVILLGEDPYGFSIIIASLVALVAAGKVKRNT